MYYVTVTLYTLLAPLGIFKLMSRRLTLYDLNLNTSFRNQYLLAKFLYRTFALDFKLAKSGSHKIDYDPDNPKAENLEKSSPHTYRRQGVYLGVLDMVADGLILKDDLDDTIRIVTYGEFYNLAGMVNQPRKIAIILILIAIFAIAVGARVWNVLCDCHIIHIISSPRHF